MKSILSFDFTEIGCVKSAIELSGRGVTFICRNLAGQYCYSVTAKAAENLRAKYSSTYTNDNNEVVA